ncbi:MAG TPA: gluconate 2-dehydrogenase subunit 3 family protein [Vicinamibacteria bacterium]|jgi:hypothetical protein
MSEIRRRAALRLIGGAPLGVGFGVGVLDLRAAGAHAATAVAATGKGKAYRPRFFTDHEWETVRLLADLILPRDERSGSASDAGVPEFMDFLMADPEADARSLEARQTAMRGGLAWIDAECRHRFGRTLVACTDEEGRKLLDDIAYWKGEEDGGEAPEDLQVRLHHGPAFFASFRDLTASGFWSSKTGVEDLGYVGNTATVWEGPPLEVLRRLGLES